MGIINEFKKFIKQKKHEKKLRIEAELKKQKEDHITNMRDSIVKEVWEACKKENMKLNTYDVCHEKLNEALTKYRLSRKHYYLMLGTVYYNYGCWWGSQGLIRNKQAIDYFRKCYDIDPNYLDIKERLNKAIERNNRYANDSRSNSVLGMLMHQTGMNTNYAKKLYK